MFLFLIYLLNKLFNLYLNIIQNSCFFINHFKNILNFIKMRDVMQTWDSVYWLAPKTKGVYIKIKNMEYGIG